MKELSETEIEMNNKARGRSIDLFNEISDFLETNFPPENFRDSGNWAGLVVAIGAVFETFVRSARERNLIDEESEENIRINAKTLSRIMVPTSKPRAKA
jgi:hypothetical protein